MMGTYDSHRLQTAQIAQYCDAKKSLERAAEKLHISQSAVSQRFKLLEEFVGHPILIREKAIALTPIGHQLLLHFEQVELLERDLLSKIIAESPQQPFKLEVTCSIGVAFGKVKNKHSIIELIKKRDTVMYQAKKEGRNRVIC